MFTGIVQAQGTIIQRSEADGDLRLTIQADQLAARIDPTRLAIGESIAVNGVCLTVVAFDGRNFTADASRETLAVTTLGHCVAGTVVNLEPALRAGDPLGGHLVSGHVDGVATVTSIAAEARSLRVQMEAPPHLSRYIASKGSVTLDGVSLTVNEVENHRFGINLIPHTAAVTNFGSLAVGQRMNLEVDQLARHVERLLAQRIG